MTAARRSPALAFGLGCPVQVTGPNIWGEADDIGRPGHITVTDDFGAFGVQFDDDCAPFGSYFAAENLEGML